MTRSRASKPEHGWFQRVVRQADETLPREPCRTSKTPLAGRHSCRLEALFTRNSERAVEGQQGLENTAFRLRRETTAVSEGDPVQAAREQANRVYKKMTSLSHYGTLGVD